MPRLEPYSRSLDYSYCLGIYPSLSLMEARPETAFRLLLSSQAEGAPGAEKLRELCREAGVREETADKVLRRESGKENCFAALVFKKYDCRLDVSSPHAVLCQVSDGGNLGTVVRSAMAFGYRDVAVIRPAVDAFDPHVLRASMGAFFRLRLKVYDRFEDYRAEFPSRPLYPFMLDGAVDVDQAAGKAPWAHSLIFGNEAKGLDASFAGIGQSVIIPQSSEIDSLNLSVAASVGMYIFSSRQRNKQ
ncbi:MAG: TrmH family RNA methyltransferase [Clostridia bacterium]|nr:TrmH family RNA methyltransferase [Clostridia bacterium]